MLPSLRNFENIIVYNAFCEILQPNKNSLNAGYLYLTVSNVDVIILGLNLVSTLNGSLLPISDYSHTSQLFKHGCSGGRAQLLARLLFK